MASQVPKGEAPGATIFVGELTSFSGRTHFFRRTHFFQWGNSLPPPGTRASPLIVCAARSAGCTVLYSEDLQHGQRFGSLRVVNPFL